MKMPPQFHTALLKKNGASTEPHRAGTEPHRACTEPPSAAQVPGRLLLNREPFMLHEEPAPKWDMLADDDSMTNR